MVFIRIEEPGNVPFFALSDLRVLVASVSGKIRCHQARIVRAVNRDSVHHQKYSSFRHSSRPSILCNTLLYINREQVNSMTIVKAYSVQSLQKWVHIS